MACRVFSSQYWEINVPSLITAPSRAPVLSSPYLNYDPRYMQKAQPEFIFPEGASKQRGRFELAFSQIGSSVMIGAGIGETKRFWHVKHKYSSYYFRWSGWILQRNQSNKPRTTDWKTQTNSTPESCDETRISYRQHLRNRRCFVFRFRRSAFLGPRWRRRDQHDRSGRCHWTHVQIYCWTEEMCNRRLNWTCTFLPLGLVQRCWTEKDQRVQAVRLTQCLD